MKAVPTSTLTRGQKRARSPEFIRTAKVLLLRRRINEAINLLRRGLNLDPTSYDAALLLGKCLVAAKRLGEARSTLETLVEREGTLEAHVLLVRICAVGNDHAAAIAVARRGLARYPRDPQLLELLTESRLELTDLLEDTTEQDTLPPRFDLPVSRSASAADPPELLLSSSSGGRGTLMGWESLPRELATPPPLPDSALDHSLVSAGASAAAEPVSEWQIESATEVPLRRSDASRVVRSGEVQALPEDEGEPELISGVELVELTDDQPPPVDPTVVGGPAVFEAPTTVQPVDRAEALGPDSSEELQLDVVDPEELPTEPMSGEQAALTDQSTPRVGSVWPEPLAQQQPATAQLGALPAARPPSAATTRAQSGSNQPVRATTLPLPASPPHGARVTLPPEVERRRRASSTPVRKPPRLRASSSPAGGRDLEDDDSSEILTATKQLPQAPLASLESVTRQAPPALIGRPDTATATTPRSGGHHDTVQVAGTALTRPPAPEEMVTSPNYLRGHDGALEDPLLLDLEQEDEERTPLPSDDLNFDRPPAAEGSDVVKAVQRFLEPDTPPTPVPERRSALFEGLLGDGPPRRKRRPSSAKRRPSRASLRLVHSAAPVELDEDDLETPDPDELGGATPPDTPVAKQREYQRWYSAVADQSELHRPSSVPTADPEPPPVPPVSVRSQESHIPTADVKLTDSRVALPVDEADEQRRLSLAEAALASGLARAVQVSQLRGEAIRSALRGPGGAGGSARRAERARGTLARWWPLWLTVGLFVIAGATVAGLVVRQRAEVARALQSARTLADKHQPASLRQALHRIREAANLGGRGPGIVALAAAIHGELAFEFGESTPQGAQSLVEEAQRLDAKDSLEASDDLAVAQAYLKLCHEPLPEVIGHLLKESQQRPRNRRLKVLYGKALILNGELSLAEEVLKEVPADDLDVLQARALLFWKKGEPGLTTRLLRLAGTFGLQPELVELSSARYEILGGSPNSRILGRLEQLTRGTRLPARQRAWGYLLMASLHQRSRDSEALAKALEQALALQPVADADFSYQAARLLLSQHRLDQALYQVREARRIAPRDRRFVVLQAEVELTMDRARAAVERLAGLRDLGPRGRLVLARAYTAAGQLDKARSLLQALNKEPTPARRVALARLQLAAGSPFRAVQALAGLEQGRADARVVRGLVALHNQDSPGVQQWMRSALEKDPCLPDALWALGVVAGWNADAKQMRHYLEQALKANRHHRRARRDLGRLLLKLGQYRAAQKHFDQLLQADPTDIQALMGRAQASVERGDSDAALYIRALRGRGHTTESRLLAARLELVQGHTRQGLRRLRKLSGTVKPPHLRRSLLWLADAERRLGNLSRAADLFHEVVSLSQPDPAPEARLGLSEINLKRQAVSPALRHALSAAEDLAGGIYPRALRSRVGVQLARCYRMGDALGAAIAELQDVLERDSRNREANLELGLIYASLSKRERAVEHLSRVLEVCPDSRLARSELQRVCRDLRVPLPGCSVLTRSKTAEKK